MDVRTNLNLSVYMEPPPVGLGAAAVNAMECVGPMWLAIVLGLVLGWSWKPTWVSSFSRWFQAQWSGLCQHMTTTSIEDRPSLCWYSPFEEAWMQFSTWMWLPPPPPPVQAAVGPPSISRAPSSPPSEMTESNNALITNDDLMAFMNRLESMDRDDPAWEFMMDRFVPGLSYQSWRRDPETGPTQYRSSTVVEDVTPMLMRDFFVDDEYRLEWDDMLIHAKILEECKNTGFIIVQWIRKFPYFCKDREYIIGRRIWESDGTFYCITKGVPCSLVPRQNSPRRVDVFYSSWRIRAVESAKRDGQLTACEVMLLHHEDMGIQRDLAKLGIRQGMWGCVKKVEPAVRKYQMMRRQNRPLSPSALIAHVNTKVPAAVVLLKDSKLSTKVDEPASSGLENTGSGREGSSIEHRSIRHSQNKCTKWLILGGAVALAFGVERGYVGRLLVFGIARHMDRMKRRVRD